MKSHTPSAPAGHRFKFVGLHIDLRVQAMPFRALCRMAKQAAGFGINTLVVEWEAAFPFRKHRVISNAFAYTPEEIRRFIAFCGDLGLAVIPMQQCFGHVEYILRHECFAGLRENQKDIRQICPMRGDRALELFGDLFDEIAAAHPSPYLHIGGDETFLLGQCELCSPKAKESGKSRLYVDYFRQVAARIVKMGRQPLIWADMLWRYPEAAADMPKETIFIDWNYGWPVNEIGDPERLKKLNLRLWGAPAMRSSPDNHWLTCWHRHFTNLVDYLPWTKAMGFEGILLTSWSTSGGYGYEWDSETTIREMFPIRRVYPNAGFRILMAAFAEAVRRDTPLDAPAFVADYAVERFGLTKRNGAKLWEALVAGEAEAKGGDFTSAAKPARHALRIFESLEPQRNIREFDHLRLMADLREHHIRFRQLAARCETGNSRSCGTAAERLLVEAGQLHGRFLKLNAGELYPAEMAIEEEYRFGGIRKLLAKLQKSGRTAPVRSRAF